MLVDTVNHTVAVVLVSVLFVGMYLLPTIVAIFSKHKNTVAVFFLNLLLGWTFIGWVVALVWAAKKD